MWLTVIGWINYNTVIVMIMSLKETNHFSIRNRDGGPELDLYENLFSQIFTHGLSTDTSSSGNIHSSSI